MPSVNTRWRLLCWSDIINESLQKPIFGWGLGKKFIPETIKKLGWGGSWMEEAKFSKDKTGFQDPHNSYLSIFHRTGFIGVFVFFWLMISFIIVSISHIKGSLVEANSNAIISFLLIFIFVSAISVFMVVLEGPFLGIFFWIAMGFVESIIHIERNKFSEQGKP